MAKYNILTDKLNTYFTNNKMTVGSAKPTTGSWTKGDLVISNNVNDGIFGWQCKTSGTPGTWITLSTADSLTGDVTTHNHDSRYVRVNLGNVTDFNTAKTEGHYTISTSTTLPNAPATGAMYGTLEVVKRGVDLIQRVTTSSGSVYVRYFGNDSTGWRPWVKQYNSADKPTPSDIGAAPASHNHDDRYYTETEINAKLSTKSDNTHNHDSSYLKSHNGRIGDNYNFNNANVPGVYQVNAPSGAVNAPFSGPIFGTLLVQSSYSTEFSQLFVSCDGGISTRFSAVGGWREWTHIYSNVWNGHMDLHNNCSLRGKSSGGALYDLIGVDRANHIYLGWNNATYIDVQNTMVAKRDLIVENGAKLWCRGGLNIGANSGSQYPSIGFGDKHVRIEYSVGGEMYVAGSETQSSGFGTGFGAKYLRSYEEYIHVGSCKLYVSGNDPGANAGANGVWIKSW